MTSISHVDHNEDVKPFDTDPWAQQLNFQWERHFDQQSLPPKIRSSNSMWVIK